jgi:acyl-CoA synthetase (AMP-forming)/AMP-acid ligase II
VLDEEAIIAHCRVHLPMFMLPGHIELVENLPRNPNGKIDRKSLSNQFIHVFGTNAD